MANAIPCQPDTISTKMRQWLGAQIVGSDEDILNGKPPAFHSVCAWLEAQYPDHDARERYREHLELMELTVARKWRAKSDHNIHTVPAQDAAVEQAREDVEPEEEGDGREVKQHVSRFRVRLWNLGFSAESAMRGPSPLCDVLRNVDRHLSHPLGNQTEKYPVEVFFDLLGLKPGDALLPFKVGISIGFGTTLACHLIAASLEHLEKWSPWSLPQVVHALGKNMIKLFRLSVTWDPAPDTLSRVLRSNSGKIAASERQRPNPLQLHRSLLRLALESNPDGAVKGDRKLWQAVMLRVNACEKSKSGKMNPEEMNCVLLLARSSIEFRNKLEALPFAPHLEALAAWREA